MDRKEEFLKPGERLDDLQNGYWMIQNPSLFCYGIDAVLLASYAKVKRRERAMDFCTGSGIVPILLKAKTNGEHFSGLEIQEYSAEMAQRSVRYNHLENEVEIFQGDVKTASQQFGIVNFFWPQHNETILYAARRLNDNVVAHADVQLSRREIIYFSYVSKTYSYNCYHAISFPSLSGT